MSAVQDLIGQRQRRLLNLVRWSPRGRPCEDRPHGLTPRWPLLTTPTSLIVYVLGILACDQGLIGWELTHTQLSAGQLVLFAALLTAAAICIEAMRRLGQPSGVSRDLLSAWWLPIALLLPPIYVLLAPFGIGPVLYLRARRIPMYRRVFSSAALGLAGAAASATFHLAVPQTFGISLNGSHDWLARPAVIVTAVACAVLFAVLNAGIVAVAAHLAEPGAPLAKDMVRLSHAGKCSSWFPWASIGADQISELGLSAGLAVTEVWTDAGRWFAALSRGIDS